MLARRYDAPTLEKWGLINLTVPEESLETATMSIAEEFAQGPTVAHAATQATRLYRRQRGRSGPPTRRWQGCKHLFGPRKI